MKSDLVLVRGGGRTGTAIAHRLRLCGLAVVVTEAIRPTFIHRKVAFGAAIYESTITVDGVPARRAADSEGVRQVLTAGEVPVVADPPAVIREVLKPWVLVDAMGLERNVGTRLTDAPIVIGVGRGFEAGKDVHVIVDSRHSQGLGTIVARGGLPDDPAPASFPPVVPASLSSPAVGRFTARAAFGQPVAAGDILATIGDTPVKAPSSGVVSGLLNDGIFVGVGVRVAEVDPRQDPRVLDEIDPLARAIAGGVLEAILYTAAVGSEPGQGLPVNAGGPHAEDAAKDL